MLSSSAFSQSKNYAVELDGRDDYVAISKSFPSQPTDFSIIARIMSYDVSWIGQRNFIDDQEESSGGGYGFSLSDGG